MWYVGLVLWVRLLVATPHVPAVSKQSFTAGKVGVKEQNNSIYSSPSTCLESEPVLSAETERGSVSPLLVERRHNTVHSSLSWKSGRPLCRLMYKTTSNAKDLLQLGPPRAPPPLHIRHWQAAPGVRVPAPGSQRSSRLLLVLISR